MWFWKKYLGKGYRPVARILGGVVLFRKKWTFKIENSMNMTCEACWLLEVWGHPPQEILANNCMLLYATNWYQFSGKYMLYLAIILYDYRRFNWTLRQWSLICAAYNVYESDNIGLIYISLSLKMLQDESQRTWKEENQVSMKLGINLIQIYWSIRLSYMEESKISKLYLTNTKFLDLWINIQ